MEEERWKPVIGYEDYYEVSDLGRVKSLERMVEDGRGNLRRLRERILRPAINNQNLVVPLSQDGVREIKYVQRLVLEAFVGPCPPGQESRHFPDRDPSNNRLDNLRWDSYPNVLADTVITAAYIRGEEVYNAKLTDEQARQIKFVERGTQQAIADHYGISRTLVYKIKAGKGWAHLKPVGNHPQRDGSSHRQNKKSDCLRGKPNL
jgi:hypothetical protein